MGGWVGGGWVLGWVDWNEINAKSTQVEVGLEVGVELGNERMNGSLHSMDVCGLVCIHVWLQYIS